MKKANLFKNTETAQKISDIILANTDFCKMYSISNANMNTHVDRSNDDLAKTNRVTEISENADLAKQIIDTMSLDNKHFDAVKRIQVWLDSNAIVIFVGAVYAVHATLSDKTAEESELFDKLFRESFDKEYYNERRKKQNISDKTESRHVFTDISTFETFFNLLAQFVVTRKKALAETETAKEIAQQTATKEKKAQQKQKRQQKQKQKKATADFSKVNAEALAELTKEIVESEMRAK